MAIRQILEDLQQAGLSLSLVGDKLRVTPQAAITPTARALIREHKAGLLDLLRRQANDRGTTLAAPAGQHNPQGTPPPATVGEFVDRFGAAPSDFPWLEPHPGRTGLLPELHNGLHQWWCPVCGRWAANHWTQPGVFLQPGEFVDETPRRFCFDHRKFWSAEVFFAQARGCAGEGVRL